MQLLAERGFAVIAPNYLSTPEDRRVAADAIRVTRRLMRQPAMMIGAAVTMALFGVLTFVDLPWLNGLTSSDLIHLGLGR